MGNKSVHVQPERPAKGARYDAFSNRSHVEGSVSEGRQVEKAWQPTNGIKLTEATPWGQAGGDRSVQHGKDMHTTVPRVPSATSARPFAASAAELRTASPRAALIGAAPSSGAGSYAGRRVQPVSLRP